MAFVKVLVPRYKAKCDKCDCLHEFDADSPTGAWAVVTSIYEWKSDANGDLTCADCRFNRKPAKPKKHKKPKHA